MNNEAHGPATDHIPTSHIPTAPNRNDRSAPGSPETRAGLDRSDHPEHGTLPRLRPEPSAHRLLHSITRPVHSGIIGAFATDWLRAALVEALTSDERLPDVVTTHDTLDLLFRGQADRIPLDAFDARLRVFDALEDTVEHLEHKAGRILAGQTAPTTVWFAAPGDDADVVHQTIDRWSGLDLIVLLHGHWAYGPDHHPRPVQRPIPRTHLFVVPTPDDSIALLTAND
ncbi:hypothetical protein ACIBF1_20275 [Spirillospora sp. NPDC050679]